MELLSPNPNNKILKPNDGMLSNNTIYYNFYQINDVSNFQVWYVRKETVFYPKS